MMPKAVTRLPLLPVSAAQRVVIGRRQVRHNVLGRLEFGIPLGDGRILPIDQYLDVGRQVPPATATFVSAHRRMLLGESS